MAACHLILNRTIETANPRKPIYRRKSEWLVCHEKKDVPHSHDLDDREAAHLYPYKNELLIQGLHDFWIRWDRDDVDYDG